jgi:uncharacterized membrane protein
VTLISRSKKPTKTTQNQPNQPTQQPQSIVSAQWSGPLPAPADLLAFNQIIQNGAERIMQMTELEQKHRISMESLQVKESAKAIKRGQWLGFVISLLCLGLAGWSTYNQAYWVAAAFIGIPMASVVRAFLKK